MAGALTAGYFPANYFTHRYWQIGNQYWTEYGTGVAPTIVSGRAQPQWLKLHRKIKNRLPYEVREAVKEWLEIKVK